MSGTRYLGTFSSTTVGAGDEALLLAAFRLVRVDAMIKQGPLMNERGE